jgi:uncharacterized protein
MDYPVLARMPDGTGRETRPADAAGPASIIGRRSITCGRECRDKPCTLAQMSAAKRVTAISPSVTLWAELSMLAHLTGWGLPALGEGPTRQLRAMPDQLRDCAISQAVDTATVARAPAISGRVSPDLLAAHVAAAMRQAVTDGTWLCEHEEPQYLAPPFQWVIARDELERAVRDSGDGSRHADSEQWERQYGRLVPGETCAAQLHAVQHWYDMGQRDARVVAAVVWGTRAGTAIERAVGARITDGDWDERLMDALSAFRSLRWPLDLLNRAAPRPGSLVSATGQL